MQVVEATLTSGQSRTALLGAQANEAKHGEPFWKQCYCQRDQNEEPIRRKGNKGTSKGSTSDPVKEESFDRP